MLTHEPIHLSMFPSTGDWIKGNLQLLPLLHCSLTAMLCIGVMYFSFIVITHIIKLFVQKAKLLTKFLRARQYEHVYKVYQTSKKSSYNTKLVILESIHACRDHS